MTAYSITDNTITAHFDAQAYELLEKIGEGGFGLVYRAKQRNTGQIVAIKFLLLSDEFDEAKKQRYIERFERETLLGSRLQHPHIVRLLDKGRYDDLLYAVFEYVDGHTLKQRLGDSGPLLPAEAAEIMAQVLDALAHAHEQGVIHRDIKPANIMLTQLGAKTHAKVLDFGIGTLVNEARQLDYKSITLTQETLGTPSYSAPEQLRGEPPTPKTDIYVWGLVFIECLTGQPAISGSSLASIFHKQLSQSNVPLPAALAGHAAAGLLRRVLQKKANDRATSAAELYNELNQLNFSTLVGNLAGNLTATVAGSGNQPAATYDSPLIQGGDDETRVHNTLMGQTAFTERKQISTLCVALSMKVSDDELIIDDEIINALHRDQKAQCVDIAISYGGFHVGTLGNTLLFYFGYPTVSDNDSRLCARTALEIASQLGKRNPLLKQNQGIEVSACMGMHIGMVTAYADATPEGDTANIAMDLLRLADNQILCTDVTKSILDTYLEFQPQQSAAIGIGGQQIPLYALVGERQGEAFGFLRGNKHNYTFVGREQESAALQQILDHARQKHTGHKGHSMAHVHGEAGIGKSRLIFEFRNQARGFTHTIAQCLPEHKNNALYPILSVIRHKFSLDAQSPEIAVQQLCHEIDRLEEINTRDAIPIVCSWLALPLPDDFPATGYSFDVQKHILFDTLIALLLSQDVANASQPALLLFEDMHWADPASIEFIAKLSASPRFEATKTIFVSTSRQPLPVQLNTGGFQLIALTKLSKEKASEFVHNLFDKHNIAHRLLDMVVTRTDGIPLFIEELVNMLKQKHLVRHLNGITDFVNTDIINQVPVSLRDSLQQKLDTLIYAKETAQLAATIGREFDYDLLAAASNHSEAQLQIDLNELIEGELIYLQRKVAGDSYIFKHALVKDAACESMTYEMKISANKNIAQAIETHFPSVALANPNILLRYYELAKDYEKAAEYGLQWIEFKIETLSNAEAIDIAGKIEKFSENLQNGDEKEQCRFKLYDLIYPAYASLFGNVSNEIDELMAKIKICLKNSRFDVYYNHSNLSESLKDKWDWIHFLKLHYAVGGEKATKEGERLLEKHQQSKTLETVVAVQAHLILRYLFDGKIKKSICIYNDAQKLIKDLDQRKMLIQYGLDIDPYLPSIASLSLLHSGEIAMAKRITQNAIDVSSGTAGCHSTSMAYLFSALCRYYAGDEAAVIHIGNKYFNEIHDPENINYYSVYLRYLLKVANNQLDEAKRIILDIANSDQDFATGWYMHFSAKKLMHSGRIDEAIALLDISLNHALKNNELSALPIIKNTLALCLFNSHGNNDKQAIELLESSANQAKAHGSLLFQLEACICLSEIYQQDDLIEKNNSRINDLLINQELELYAQYTRSTIHIKNQQYKKT